MDATSWLVLLLVFAVNALATRKLWRERRGSRRQRLATLLAVWLLPLVGAILALTWRGSPAPAPVRKFSSTQVAWRERNGASGAVWLHVTATVDGGGGSFAGSDSGGTCHGGGDGGGGGGGDCGGGGGGGCD